MTAATSRKAALANLNAKQQHDRGESKPTALPVDADRIPPELADKKQWVVWRYDWEHGKEKWDKAPRMVTGNRASSTDPATWCSLADALAAYRTGRFDGIGFSLVKGGPYVIIDLDNCRARATGEIAAWALEILAQFPGGYSEFSPSGTGLRLVVIGVKPAKTRCKVSYQTGVVEAYCYGKYLTITGQVIDGHGEVKDGQAGIDWLLDNVLKSKPRTATKTKAAAEETAVAPAVANGHYTPTGFTPGDDDIVGPDAPVWGAANREKFSQLFDRGDRSAYGSASEADLGLLGLLEFYTRDRAQLDRLFRRSALYREKWDRETYREPTLDKALSSVSETYSWDEWSRARKGSSPWVLVCRNGTAAKAADDYDDLNEGSKNYRPEPDWVTRKYLGEKAAEEARGVAEEQAKADGDTCSDTCEGSCPTCAPTAEPAADTQPPKNDPPKHAAPKSQANGEVVSCVVVCRGGNGEPEEHPFPVDCLPPVLGEFVAQNAAAINCDPAALAVPALAVMGGAIGAKRRLHLLPTWKEPCAIWGVVVAPSGTAKSPAFKAATTPVEEINSELYRQYMDALEAEAASTPAGKKSNAKRFGISDITVEKAARILAENPAGLLLMRDELDGFFSGLNQYKGGAGSDRANWLPTYDGGQIQIDRVTGGTMIFAARGLVSICGTIQPAIFKKAMSAENRASGMMPRFLTSRLRPRSRPWNPHATVSKTVLENYASTVRGLRGLSFLSDNPVDVHLSPDAKQLWGEFHDEHDAERMAFGEHYLASVWAKAEAWAARLALICHLVATRDDCPSDVSAESLATGIKLARWFGEEAKRLEAELGDGKDADVSPTDELIAFIEGRPGDDTKPPKSVTARDLMQWKRTRYGDATAAEMALRGLGKTLKPGSTPPKAKGGRRTFYWQMAE